ncbi:MAG: type II toxin-antitoxin system RelB/DinJ family antitoxin [Oscillospiraceae bacterium]|nr:type II toxin-antitoxin system RelB/DinJ family antitoxin [Oscillospiraceae bacterium]
MSNTTPDTNLNIRINKEIKSQADELFNQLGLTLTSAVNIFIRQAIRQQKIPFEISMNYPNAETLAAIEESEQLSKDPNAKIYSNFAEILSDLNDV